MYQSAECRRKYQMTPGQLKRILTRGESVMVEFKEARDTLPRDLFETVCAFLNRDGGTILLGVADDGTVIGVSPEAVQRLTMDIVNLSNNPQKVDPPFILSPTAVEHNGHKILILHVPASGQVHRCAGVVYDRGHEGDFRVQEPVRIAAIVNRKTGYHSEQMVHPWLKFSDFDRSLFDKARRWIKARHPDHAWLGMSDRAMLVKRFSNLFRPTRLTPSSGGST
jgi:ATP-dependent DNA helicase RecG